MATPTFYWYPEADGHLEQLDLGEGLQDLQESPRAEADDAYSGDGVMYRHHLLTSTRVRIILDRFGSPGTNAVERKLKALESHLFRGGPVGFSLDHAKTWCTKLSGIFLPTRGDDTFTYDTNSLSVWSSSATLASGDEMVLESAPPSPRTELALFSAFAAGPPTTITLQSDVIYTYTSATVLRWRDCYPVLFLPRDQIGRPIVSHDHRRNWTLDLTLEYSVAAALSLWDGGDPPDLRATSGVGGESLQDLIRGGNP